MKSQKILRGSSVKILKALASYRNEVTTLTKIAKLAGFKSSRNKEFRRGLQFLEDAKILEVQQSGYKGHSTCHTKIVVLTTDIIWLHTKEPEDIPESEPSFNIHSESSFNTKLPKKIELVEIKSVLGTTSYCKREDYEKLQGQKKLEQFSTR